jgi:hypothetical protein
MAYRFVTVRTQDDDDGTMYPIFSAPGTPYLFEIEPADGGNIAHFVAKGLSVKEQGGRASDVLKVSEVKLDVYITDARVVVCCEKFDKGGGWSGFGAGAVFALGANAVSKARAAHRRKGKMLTGHVRYTWLSQVGGSTKAGFLDEEQLRIVVKDGSQTDAPLLLIDLTLPKSLDSIAIAQSIAQRCAHYRLASAPIDTDEERQTFTDLTSASRRESTKGTFGMHQMPNYWFVKPSTAVVSRQPSSAPTHEVSDTPCTAT